MSEEKFGEGKSTKRSKYTKKEREKKKERKSDSHRIFTTDPLINTH